MLENENLGNEMNNVEEVNYVVLPEEVTIVENKSNNFNGALIGAAIGVAGIAAYKVGPKVFNKVKGMLAKETLEDKRTRLLKELSDVNSELSGENVDEIQSDK